ncbi:MAG: hypothetical protein JXQ99_04170 [Hyphomicrobiaceae bacterium]
MKSDIVVKFDGQLAKDHVLPAYEAGLAIANIARAISIPAAYLEGMRVQKKNVSARYFQLNLTTQREGSYEAVYQFVMNAALLGSLGQAVGINITADFVKQFVYTVINRAVGRAGDSGIEALEQSESLNPGDLAALGDAIEPALRESHRIIGNGAGSITIIGSHNNIVFDSRTKSHLNTSVTDDTVRVREFSVASFNANTGNGRVFDFEEGRTIFFELDRDADAQTIQLLTQSMSNYAISRRLGDEMSSRVALVYDTVEDVNGHTKKLTVFEARPIIAQIGDASSK